MHMRRCVYVGVGLNECLLCSSASPPAHLAWSSILWASSNIRMASAAHICGGNRRGGIVLPHVCVHVYFCLQDKEQQICTAGC